MKNICKFIPENANGNLSIINFVYETQNRNREEVSLTYFMGVAVSGTATLYIGAEQYCIEPGDLFIILPNRRFRIESSQDFSYLYLTFAGVRANALAERANLFALPALFKGEQALKAMWEQGIKSANQSNADLISESILLYTFSRICTVFAKMQKSQAEPNVILQIKAYTDTHFQDTEMCLQSVAKQYAYSTKYISEQFKLTVKMGFNAYVQMLRMEHAQKLMQSGMQNVNEIAHLCGYKDPLYFSRRFKQQFGISPKQYIQKKEL